MVTTTIHDDMSSNLYLREDNKTWIFAADASNRFTASNAGTVGIFVQGQNSALTINGLVSVEEDGTDDPYYPRALVLGSHIEVKVGSQGVLNGYTGVSGGYGGIVDNAGTIIGNGFGTAIFLYSNASEPASVHNTGYIFGSRAVYLAAAKNSLVNEASGMIIGSDEGIKNDNATDVGIANHGMIKVGGTAIALSGGSDTVSNDGSIYGYVSLGAGNDAFDNRGGYLDGSISGGAGNDTLIVDNARYKLEELPSGGDLDTLRSSVTYTGLRGHFYINAR